MTELERAGYVLEKEDQSEREFLGGAEVLVGID
jgi:hypothetical protein